VVSRPGPALWLDEDRVAVGITGVLSRLFLGGEPSHLPGRQVDVHLPPVGGDPHAERGQRVHDSVGMPVWPGLGARRVCVLQYPDAVVLENNAVALISRTVEWEPQLHTSLRVSLEPGADQALLRRGRATGWIEDALAPLRDTLPPGRLQFRPGPRVAATPQPFLFGVCAPGGTSPICAADPGTMPKAMDVITPSGVNQATEMDPTLGPVVVRAVPVP
jgi:hypothetical protein